MSFDGNDFYAALIHELKNSLGLLSMSIERIPLQGSAEHDAPVDEARLLCQGVIDRLNQALLIYKAANGAIHPMIDAASPHDLVHELAGQTLSLSRGRLQVETAVADDVPALWFFDRDLVDMALINAIHNALRYAQTAIRIEAAMRDGCLALTVRDDSSGYPDHVLESVAAGAPIRASGTGLGLQFGRMIAQSHDNRGRRGELRLANDGGAVFELRLP